ncbi:glycosyltransferase family 49 protein [Atractiella rhizophila]|nr:glycosyltransferase family 49 protein [Atractiella rhizophila]
MFRLRFTTFLLIFASGAARLVGNYFPQFSEDSCFPPSPLSGIRLLASPEQCSSAKDLLYVSPEGTATELVNAFARWREQWHDSEKSSIFYWSHLFPVEKNQAEATAEDVEVMLLTHLSISRLRQLSALLSSWEGPAIVAIYIQGLTWEVEQLHTFLASFPSREGISWVIYNNANQKRGYPINWIRNISLSFARSLRLHLPGKIWILMMDVDFSFLPSLNASSAYNTVLSFLTSKSAQEQKKGYIVPVFRNSSGSMVPTDRNAGHGLYHRFLALDLSPSQDEEIEVIYAPQSEPYLLLPLPLHPPFDTRFRTQGGDKQSFVAVLNSLGYSFWLPPFPSSVSAIHWPEEEDGRGEKWWGEPDEEEDSKRFGYFGEWQRDMKHIHGWTWKWPKGSEADKLGSEGSWGRGMMDF